MLRRQPEDRTRNTMIQTGVSGRKSPQPAVTAAARQAVPASSRRKPNQRKKVPESTRTSIAPRLDENDRRPDWSGLIPNPTWNKSGSRNGVASRPIRQKAPVTVPMRNGADLQQPEIEDRIRTSSRMSAVEQQDGKGGDKEECTQGSRDQRASDILDREFEQPEAEPGDKKSGQVEPGWRRSAEILDPPERQRHADDADR